MKNDFNSNKIFSNLQIFFLEILKYWLNSFNIILVKVFTINQNII